MQWTLTPEMLADIERSDAATSIPLLDEGRVPVGCTNTELLALRLMAQRRALLRAYKSLVAEYEQGNARRDDDDRNKA